MCRRRVSMSRNLMIVKGHIISGKLQENLFYRTDIFITIGHIQGFKRLMKHLSDSIKMLTTESNLQ